MEDFPTLSNKDRDRMRQLNSKNGYGISYATLGRLTRQHRAARKNGDKHTMELIEYRLTHINFHHEAGMLQSGQYEDLLKELTLTWRD